MKFNITFLLKGPGGTFSVPHAKNPIEAENIKELMVNLEIPLDTIECIGIGIKPASKEYVLQRGQLLEEEHKRFIHIEKLIPQEIKSKIGTPMCGTI